MTKYSDIIPMALSIFPVGSAFMCWEYLLCGGSQCRMNRRKWRTVQSWRSSYWSKHFFFSTWNCNILGVSFRIFHDLPNDMEGCRRKAVRCWSTLLSQSSWKRWWMTGPLEQLITVSFRSSPRVGFCSWAVACHGVGWRPCDLIIFLNLPGGSWGSVCVFGEVCGKAHLCCSDGENWGGLFTYCQFVFFEFDGPSRIDCYPGFHVKFKSAQRSHLPGWQENRCRMITSEKCAAVVSNFFFFPDLFP